MRRLLVETDVNQQFSPSVSCVLWYAPIHLRYFSLIAWFGAHCILAEYVSNPLSKSVLSHVGDAHGRVRTELGWELSRSTYFNRETDWDDGNYRTLPPSRIQYTLFIVLYSSISTLERYTVKTTGVTYYDRATQICLGNNRATQGKTTAVVY